MATKKKVKGLVVGGVYKLAQKPEIGSQYVAIVSIHKDIITAQFGHWDGNAQAFYPRTITKDKHRVGKQAFPSAQFEGAEFLTMDDRYTNNGENMSNKDAGQVNETPELEYVMDGEGAPSAEVNPELPSDSQPTSGGGKKPKETAKEKAARILREEKEREKAKAEKEKAKAKEKERKEKEKAMKSQEKQTDKLAELIQKAGLKTADVVSQFGGEGDNAAKSLKAFTSEQAAQATAHLKEVIKNKTKETALAAKTQLNDEEQVELKTLEKQVEKNLAEFQHAAFEIGSALSIISQKKLYRATHKTFEAYVLERFDLSRPQAYSVMSAAKTFEALTEGQKFNAKDLPSIRAAEAINSGTQKLLKEAGLTDSPEVAAITRQIARNVYNLAVQDAPKDQKTGQPILSPAHITSVFSVLNDVAKTGLVEVDGEQVPVNLAAASIDEMITTESSERMARAKATLADQMKQAEERMKNANNGAGAGASRVEGAVNAAFGATEVPAGVIPKLFITCSFHGKGDIRNINDDRTELDITCGCTYVDGAEGWVWKSHKTPASAQTVITQPE